MRTLFFSPVFVVVAVLMSPAALAQTLAEFESSAFFKREILVEKSSAYKLRTGGTNNPYSFKDTENPYSSFGVEVTTKGEKIVEIGIHWNGRSTSEPARLTLRRKGTIKALAEFWGVSAHTDALIKYAESQQGRRYPGGSSQAPRKVIGPVSIHAGTTGETLWLGWQTTSVKTTKGTSQTSAAVTIGTLADSVLARRGKAASVKQVGRDDNGLLVEWQYPDETYLMARRLQGGIEAYRVIKITPRQ